MVHQRPTATAISRSLGIGPQHSADCGSGWKRCPDGGCIPKDLTCLPGNSARRGEPAPRPTPRGMGLKFDPYPKKYRRPTPIVPPESRPVCPPGSRPIYRSDGSFAGCQVGRAPPDVPPGEPIPPPPAGRPSGTSAAAISKSLGITAAPRGTRYSRCIEICRNFGTDLQQCRDHCRRHR